MKLCFHSNKSYSCVINAGRINIAKGDSKWFDELCDIYVHILFENASIRLQSAIVKNTVLLKNGHNTLRDIILSVSKVTRNEYNIAWKWQLILRWVEKLLFSLCK